MSLLRSCPPRSRRKRSAMRRRGLPTAQETRPAHPLEQKLTAFFCSSLCEPLTRRRKLTIRPNPQHGGLRKKQFHSHGTRQPAKHAQANALRPKLPWTHGWHLRAQHGNFSSLTPRRQLDADANGSMRRNGVTESQARERDPRHRTRLVVEFPPDQIASTVVKQHDHPLVHFPALGKVLDGGAAVLVKGILMTTRGAAFTEPMRCARNLVFAGLMAGMKRGHRIRTPNNRTTPFKTRFVFIPYRHRSPPICVILLAA